METIRLTTDIIQNIVIISTAVFTAFWAYRTFAYKDRIDDLKNIVRLLEQLHWEVFFYQVIFSKSDNKSSRSIDDLLTYCSELQYLSKTSFYMPKKDRIKVREHIRVLTQNVLLNWLNAVDNKNDLEKLKMQFEEEYDNIMRILEKHI